MILSGNDIEAREILSPFNRRTKKGSLTYGCGPASYDVRVEFDDRGQINSHLLKPGDFILASTIEHFVMPNDLVAVAHDKSTWARLGIAIQNTVIDPGWTGYLTLEISNHSGQGIVIERGDPIAQIVFHRLSSPAVPYSGKYQNQPRGPIQAR